jgi:hypothetical protein
MSKRIICLQQIVQDLESRYGESDTDVQKLQVELNALVALKEKYQQMRRATQPFRSSFQEVTNRNEWSQRTN